MTPTHPHSNQQPTGEPLWQQSITTQLQGLEASLSKSINLFRLFGYGLLVLAVFDLVVMMIPFQGLNPEWEFQTFGQIVEKTVIPLLAFVFIFAGYEKHRSAWELPVLRILSWLCLAQAVVLVLLVPLGVINTYRVNNLNSDRVVIQLEQQRVQIQQAREQLQQASTVESLTPLLQASGVAGAAPNAPVADLKNDLSTSLTQAQSQLDSTALALRSRQRLDLLKTAIKWCLGALVSAALFYCLWQASSWVRV